MDRGTMTRRLERRRPFKKTRKRTAQLRLFSVPLPHPPYFFAAYIKTRAGRLRSNGDGNEKSRSRRAEGEKKGRHAEIRRDGQMKANLR